jgi:hypothetical protein
MQSGLQNLFKMTPLLKKTETLCLLLKERVCGAATATAEAARKEYFAGNTEVTKAG